MPGVGDATGARVDQDALCSRCRRHLERLRSAQRAQRLKLVVSY